MFSKSYKKNIAEGKSILIFSLVFAIFMRTLYYSMSNISYPIHYGGYLWSDIAYALHDHLVSFIVSNIFVVFIAFVLAYINNRFAFIRENTSLPFAFALFFFCCHPMFILMNPGYIGLLVVLYCVVVLFDSYNGNQKQLSATKIAFALAVGSLFVSLMWLLLPIFWIALGMMRSFSVKAFFASLFGIIIVYFPLFSYYLFFDRLNEFYAPFTQIANVAVDSIPVLNFDKPQWLIVGFIAILFLFSMIDAYMNTFKDKVKVRSYFGVLCILVFLLGTTSLVYSIASDFCFYSTLGILCLVLSHFFALNNNRSTILLFYFSFSIYLIICILPFL